MFNCNGFQLSGSEKKYVEKQFKLSKFLTIGRKRIALRISRQNGAPSEEHPFQIHSVFPSRQWLFIHSPNNLFLPDALNKLRIGSEVELRAITYGEKSYSHALEILDQPISWWMAQPGFEVLLSALKLKPITQLPTPIDDQIDKFFDANQRRAIDAAFDDERQLLTIHGPRGSGKTLVAAEIISKVKG